MSLIEKIINHIKNLNEKLIFLKIGLIDFDTENTFLEIKDNKIYFLDEDIKYPHQILTILDIIYVKSNVIINDYIHLVKQNGLMFFENAVLNNTDDLTILENIDNSFIVQKKLLPYYERSCNHKLYKEIINIKRNYTLQSYNDMDKFNSIAEKHNIKYVSVAGTILGLNRHGGIIPWDNDIDIGLVENEWKKLHSVKKELEKQGLKYVIHSKGHCHYGTIDCFLLKLNGEYYTGEALTYCHKQEYNDIRKQIFGYTYVYAPMCSVKSLKHRYGEQYFTVGDVNDNFHYKNKNVPKFILNNFDLSFQVKN
jgi:hypothetical protein